MKFQIVNPAGAYVMVTEHSECLYDKETISDMNSAGYKFRIDGKLVPVSKFKEYLSGNSISDTSRTDDLDSKQESDKSIETKNNLKSSFFHSSDNTSKIITSSTTHKFKMKVRCIDTGEIFSKQSEAAKKYGIDPAAVSDSLKTGRKRAGYTFEWVGD